MTDQRDLVMGLDLGTSALKGALFDRDGNVHAHARGTYPLHLTQGGIAEQNPQDWWTAITAVVGTLMRETSGADRRLRGLSISAQMCGVIPVNASGEALRPCMTWLDTRSANTAQEMMRGWPRLSGYGLWRLLLWLKLTNGAPNLAGKDAISKFRWLEQNEPDIWSRTVKLLDVKDWLLHRFTGSFVTSEDCAHLTWLMDARAGHKRWSPTLIRLTKIDGAKLPDIVKATAMMGPIRAQTAKSLGLPDGLPVVAGAGELCAVALASGVTALHVPHLNIGTSSWIGALSSHQRVDIKTGVGTICAADGENYLLIATQEAAGASLVWAARALFPDKEDNEAISLLAAAAEKAPVHSHSPMFFPWMFGERAPINSDTARGSLIHLSLDTKRESLARAIVEGIGLNTRWALEAIEKLLGPYEGTLRVTGGVAESPLLVQCLADSLGRSLEIMEHPTLAGARGAAMLAAVGAGWYETAPQAAAAMARPLQTITPDPQSLSLGNARFAIYKKAYGRLQPLHGMLAKLP